MNAKRDSARQHTGLPSQRQLRMGEAIRHALAEIIARGEVRDPALRDLPITVTEVKTTPDLRHATVYVTPLGGQNMDEIVGALKRARGFYRARVAHMVEAKYVPELSFRADESFEQARRIDEILSDSRASTAEDADAPQGGDTAGETRDEDGHGRT